MQTSIRVLMLIAILLGACTPQSKLTYLQNKAPYDEGIHVRETEYRLKPGDIVHVRVQTTDPVAPGAINFFDIRRYTRGAGDVGNPDMYLHGYSIDQSGHIHMPVIGLVHLAGFTLEEAQEFIRKEASTYLLDASVSVKLVNFSVTILGEVRRPGTYYIYDHNITIMDALGMAGDMTDYGNRNLHIVRQSADGLIFTRLDITDREASSSWLYQLQPNDLVYVEPRIAKRFGFAQFPFSVMFSAISTGLLLFGLFN